MEILEENEVFKRNRFSGYLEKIRDHKKRVGLNLSYVSEVVNVFYQIKGLDKQPSKFYSSGRYARPKLSNEAKMLLDACGNNLEDALWSLDKMKYLAEKGKFDWSISTCLKHNLIT